MLQVPAPIVHTDSSAFWGDSVHAARQLVDSPDAKLDFLVGDYLAGPSGQVRQL
jgi:hypothetical protein